MAISRAMTDSSGLDPHNYCGGGCATAGPFTATRIRIGIMNGQLLRINHWASVV